MPLASQGLPPPRGGSWPVRSRSGRRRGAGRRGSSARSRAADSATAAPLPAPRGLPVLQDCQHAGPVPPNGIDYPGAHLLEPDVPADPYALFDALAGRCVRRPRTRGGCPSRRRWCWPPYDGGRPSARTVLLKEVDARGFVFFTNYDSRKGTELAANPQVALHFGWYAAAAPGPRRGAAEPGAAGRVRGVLRHPPARLPAGRLGVGAVVGGRRRSGRAGASAYLAGGAALRRARRALPCRTGAASGSSRRRSSSGRASRAGCTTGCATTAPATTGRSAGWRPDHGEPRPPSRRRESPISSRGAAASSQRAVCRSSRIGEAPMPPAGRPRRVGGAGRPRRTSASRPSVAATLSRHMSRNRPSPLCPSRPSSSTTTAVILVLDVPDRPAVARRTCRAPVGRPCARSTSRR